MRRRVDQRTIIQLDRYRKPVLAAIALVFILSMLDGFMTLLLIEHGAVELNPVMAYFLDHGPLTFVLVKYMLTAMSVVLVVALHYVQIPFLRLFISDLIPLFVSAFVAVVAWQLYLALSYVF